MKHVCKPKYHHLKIVNMPFPKRKHGTYEAQTRHLRRVNTALIFNIEKYRLNFRKYIKNTFSSDYHLKRASPKAANIHNRWWRERSERNLRFHSNIIKRPRRGRTWTSFNYTPYVRPLRGRFYHLSWDRRLRCLRQLNQRLWIFAAFLLWQATKSSAATLTWDNFHILNAKVQFLYK